jgi:ribosomal protein S18 acetylase RimI-like enzyme
VSATPPPSSVAGVRIVPAADIAVAELQTLVEACFAGRPREPEWLARKLVREAVDRERSLLALGPGDQAIGYTLAGADDDAHVAHSAGLGVLPAWRRQGLGSALLLGLTQPLRSAGFTALRVLAEPPLRGFYQRLGFRPRTERHTLWAPGTGAADLDLRALPRLAWALPGRAVAGWREGTWTRTPDADAATVQLTDADAWAHLSREGTAVLIQRLCLAPDDRDDSDDDERRIHAALTQLRARFHRDTAVLLYGCDVVSCITASLMQAQWRVAQTACEMQRDLGDAVDKHASPTP